MTEEMPEDILPVTDETNPPFGPKLNLAIEPHIPKPKVKVKRDIIRFSGGLPTAINLEHVTSMYLEGKRITFEFYTKAQFVDFGDEAAAASVFEALMITWSGETEK